jgi:hypothetical protein
MLTEAVGSIPAFGRRVGWWSIGLPVPTGARHDVSHAIRVVAAVLRMRVVG